MSKKDSLIQDKILNAYNNIRKIQRQKENLRPREVYAGLGYNLHDDRRFYVGDLFNHV